MMSSGRTRPNRCLSTCTAPADAASAVRKNAADHGRFSRIERDRAGERHDEDAEPPAADPVHHLREARA